MLPFRTFSMPKIRPRTVTILVLVGFVAYFFISEYSTIAKSKASFSSLGSRTYSNLIATSEKPFSDDYLPTPDHLLLYSKKYTLEPTDFGELGHRIRILLSWIEGVGLTANTIPSSVKEFLGLTFPFLRRGTGFPLFGLLKWHAYLHGVVIPVGTTNFRYACHLVGSIRNVLNSSIPVEIAYGGDEDLPPPFRESLQALNSDVTMVDVSAEFNDDFLDLKHGGFAIKPFAILASKFQKVMLLDADAVLLQKPETFFADISGFNETGTLLFHDRLLFKGKYSERHQWWKSQMKHTKPSGNFLNSLTQVDGYAEEADSGLVMIDKGRLPVLIGLLHVAWQNTKEVRDSITYRMGYGDKETWWFGFELCNVPYYFAPKYAAVLGEKSRDTATGIDNVCSYTIAHTGEDDSLLWLNGSLLKNKAISALEYWVPDALMINGEWEKGTYKESWSCKKDGDILTIDTETTSILKRSVKEAQRVDRELLKFLRSLRSIPTPGSRIS